MPLNLRKNTGNDPLTYEQLDGNFEYFTGSHAITGSLVVSGDITGTLLGTASTASFVTLAQTASYVENAQTASFVTLAQTASYVENAQTASFVTLAQTASYVDPTFISASAAASGFGSGGTSIDTGSFATTGSNVFVGNQTISGSINFGDGSTIQSIPSSSGDGLGLPTLELIPDSSLGTDQYLILDPTGPNHIHIRAGGTIDNSTANLIIGGEDINLVVSDNNSEIEMKRKSVLFVNDYTFTPGVGYSTAVWSSSGSVHIITLNDPTIDAYTATSLIIPNPPSFFSVIDSNSTFSILEVLSTSAPGGLSPIVLTVDQAPPANPISLDQVYFEINQYADSYVRVNSDVTIEAIDDLRMYSRDIFSLRNYSTTDSVDIITQYDSGNENMWEFTPGGDTLFPGDISTPGNITADSFTGSLEGTASYATYAENAQTASFVTLAQTASFVTTTQTASYVDILNQDVIISGSILISGSLIPNTDGVSVTSSFDLGSPTNAWKDIYVSNGTINFLDGAGNIQGTVGAGTAGTVITGSLNVISYGDEELNLETQGYNGVFSKLSKQKLTSAGIKLAADYSTGLSLNSGLYTYFSDPILPWDRKINTFYVYNNLSSSVSPSLLYLPPINNAPYTPGEIITVYNISPSASSNIRNSGSLKISCFAQGILGVDTGSKNVTSAQNTQCPILSGSWGDFKSINPSSGYSASLEILPGKKVSFEVINWGNFSIGTSSNYPFYNGDFSGDGYSDATYGAIYKLISISDI